MITLADIDGQSLSSVICDFMICKRCGIVDRERSRIVANSPCPTCHKSAGIARLYFGLNLAVLIDLIQQSYHSATPEGQALGPQSSDVAVVLFFCALREALFNNLLKYLLDTEEIISRGGLKSKVSQLEERIGRTWGQAVREVSSHEGIGFDSVSKLMIEASGIRNRFMHEASGWGATRQFATECINSTFALLQLFASLHNLYAQPRLAIQHDPQ
jgi:hypothetical protein